MQKITPMLWYDGNAEEAVKLYTSVFPNSKIVTTTRYGDAGPGPKGQVMTIAFDIAGQRFTALNGGPQFKFTEAVSFVVNVETQEELDAVWNKLLEGGGQPSQCGWLKDRFGLSWQVVPRMLMDLLQDSDAEKSKRVVESMMQMVKFDIPALKRAAENAPTRA